MAKTTHTDGVSTVWAAFLNSIYGAAAGDGHKHDGLDADGSAGKIDPETETDWGTNAAAPSKSLDTAGSVLWSFAHAAAGLFGFEFDFLKVADIIPLGSSQLHVQDGSNNDQDIKVRDVVGSGDVSGVNATFSGDLSADDITAGGDVTASSGTVSGANVTATGTVTGVIGAFTTFATATDNSVQASDVVFRFSGQVSDGACTVDKDAKSSVTGVARASGVYNVTLASAVTSTKVPIVFGVDSTLNLTVNVVWTSTTQFTLSFKDDTGTLQDPGGCSVAIWDF